MDTITHALSGALLARAMGRAAGSMSLARRTLVGTVAAAFPDIDFLLVFIDPMTYLTWHRGPTHSIPLLPLWAPLLAGAFYLIFRRQVPFRSLFLVCLAGLTIHIAGDVITVYGTTIFSPFSEYRATLSTTFIIDLFFSGILITGLLISSFWRPKLSAQMGISVLLLYVGLQWHWHGQALDLADRYAASKALSDYQVMAIPQPLSPLHWKLVVINGGTYHQAYVRLQDTGPPLLNFGWMEQIAGNYLPPAQANWTSVARYGESTAEANLARHVWQRREIAPFRNFAVLPALLRVDNHGARECVWFTDLRFVIENLLPPFRYGLCRQVRTEAWRLERLRRL